MSAAATNNNNKKKSRRPLLHTIIDRIVKMQRTYDYLDGLRNNKVDNGQYSVPQVYLGNLRNYNVILNRTTNEKKKSSVKQRKKNDRLKINV